MSEELKTILAKFAQSGWGLIGAPAKDYLCRVDNGTILR